MTESSNTFGTQGGKCLLSRRKFLKCLLTAGVVATIPCGLLRPMSSKAEEIVYEGDYNVFRNACPRNCYDTCSIKTSVKDGVIQFIEGRDRIDLHPGRTVRERLWLHPPSLQPGPHQVPHGPGRSRNRKLEARLPGTKPWTVLPKNSWKCRTKDGTLLGLALSKYSGNFGITNYGVEGMMSSLGYTTRLTGTPCWPAGIDAQNFDMGDMWCNDPEDMVHARYVILWGGNPAWNSVHSVKYVYEARTAGPRSWSSILS